MSTSESQHNKRREFWLAKPDLDFDLNWKRIHAAEFPHNNTKVDCLHVREVLPGDDNKQLISREHYRSILLMATGFGMGANQGDDCEKAKAKCIAWADDQTEHMFGLLSEGSERNETEGKA